MKYIQNTYASGIEVKVKPADGRTVSVHFERYKVDRLNGQVLSDGYTEIEDGLYKELEKNAAFRMCRDKGWLVVHNEAPLRAGSFEQMLELKAHIQRLEEENAALKEENAALKEENAALKAKLAAAAAPAPVQGTAGARALADMSYNELKALAKEKGIKEIPAKKADLIAAIEALGSKEM